MIDISKVELNTFQYQRLVYELDKTKLSSSLLPIPLTPTERFVYNMKPHELIKEFFLIQSKESKLPRSQRGIIERRVSKELNKILK